ncbi:MAG: hypothetical protein AB1505_00750 [Candidatus Latescibacterota bacterium]
MRRMTTVTCAATCMLGSLLAGPLPAQGPLDWGGDRFLLTGYAFAGSRSPAGEEVEVFGLSPILLVRPGDRVLVEIEPELELAATREGRTERELELERAIEYAHVDLLLHDNLTVLAGRWLTPVGVFVEKLHPAWINKLPTAPILYGHDGLLPVNQVGLQLRGGALVGAEAKLNYAFFASTGPQLGAHGGEEGGEGMEEGAGEAMPEEPEEVAFEESWTDNNSSPAFGGRLGFSPRSRLEVGGSFFRGAYDDDGDFSLTYVGADAEYRLELVELRGEYLRRTQETGAGDMTLTGVYAQGALKLSIVPLMFLNPTELVLRYGRLSGEGTSSQAAVGLNYALTSRSFLRLALTSDDVPDAEGRTNRLYLSLAHGL